MPYTKIGLTKQRKLPEKRQGAPWIEIDEFKNKKKRIVIKAPQGGGRPNYFFIQGGGNLLSTGREVDLTYLPTHQSRCSADLH